VPRPVQLDLKQLAAGVVRANVGVEAIELRARGRMEGAELVLAESGQRLPVQGAPAGARRAWLRFEARGWEAGEKVVLQYLGDADHPAAFDAGTR
jgi:hypothetical protein